MTNSFLQTVPVVVARCCSIFPHERSIHSLCLMPCVALRGSLGCRLPRNPCSSAPAGSAPEWLSTTFDTSLPSGHRQRKRRLADFADTEQSKSNVCWLSLRQMTITHLALRRLALLVRLGFQTIRQASAIFFKPSADRVTSDPKGASQASQTAAFLVGSQNGGFLKFAITERLRIVAAATTTIVA
jgi:hypothetical protein